MPNQKRNKQPPESAYYDSLKQKSVNVQLNFTEGTYGDNAEVVHGTLRWVDTYSIGVEVGIPGQTFVKLIMKGSIAMIWPGVLGGDPT